MPGPFVSKKDLFTEKSLDFMRVPRFRASPRHGGAERFKYLVVTDPPRGRPFGGGDVHHKGNIRLTIYRIPLADFSDCFGILNPWCY